MLASSDSRKIVVASYRHPAWLPAFHEFALVHKVRISLGLIVAGRFKSLAFLFDGTSHILEIRRIAGFNHFEKETR